MENVQGSTVNYSFIISNYIKEFFVDRGFTLKCSETSFSYTVDFMIKKSPVMDIPICFSIPKNFSSEITWVNIKGDHIRFNIASPKFFDELREGLLEPVLDLNKGSLNVDI